MRRLVAWWHCPRCRIQWPVAYRSDREAFESRESDCPSCERLGLPTAFRIPSSLKAG
jgi:hypothetical protein